MVSKMVIVDRWIDTRNDVRHSRHHNAYRTLSYGLSCVDYVAYWAAELAIPPTEENGHSTSHEHR